MVALLLAVLISVPESHGSRGKLDFKGGLLLAGGLSLLTVALAQRSLFSVDSVLPYAVAAGGVLLLLMLVLVEARATEPLFNRTLFLARTFAAAMSAQFLIGAALILALVTVPIIIT